MCVYDNEGFDCQFDLGVKDRCQIYLNSVLLLLTKTLRLHSNLFDGGCSYLAQGWCFWCIDYSKCIGLPIVP